MTPSYPLPEILFLFDPPVQQKSGPEFQVRHDRHSADIKPFPEGIKEKTGIILDNRYFAFYVNLQFRFPGSGTREII